MRRAITQLRGVVAYADSHAVTRTVDQYLGLFWVFIGIMIVLGAVLALAVIYVTMAVNVVERTNELATLRAAGVPSGRVAGTLATESLVATALGVPIGLVLGVIAARASCPRSPTICSGSICTSTGGRCRQPRSVCSPQPRCRNGLR